MFSKSFFFQQLDANSASVGNDCKRCAPNDTNDLDRQENWENWGRLSIASESFAFTKEVQKCKRPLRGSCRILFRSVANGSRINFSGASCFPLMTSKVFEPSRKNTQRCALSHTPVLMSCGKLVCPSKLEEMFCTPVHFSWLLLRSFTPLFPDENLSGKLQTVFSLVKKKEKNNPTRNILMWLKEQKWKQRAIWSLFFGCNYFNWKTKETLFCNFSSKRSLLLLLQAIHEAFCSMTEKSRQLTTNLAPQ